MNATDGIGAMVPPTVLRVSAVSKHYPIYAGAGQRLVHALFGERLVRPRMFTALEHVSFDLKAGDSLAVLGRNGAGKSTLLQILAGVVEASEGEVSVPPRTAGLLELGSGFNPEFTGRENAYLNGAILGLSRRRVDERIDGIVEFADIGDFIDQPVKTYSTGMFLRLAFSVAINVEPELLLVDEALTVGDIFFQQKCYRRLRELREHGMTVLLVTHSLADAAEFCNRGIVLSRGHKVFDGTGREAVEYYLHHEDYQSGGDAGVASMAAGLSLSTPDAHGSVGADDGWLSAPATRHLTDRPRFGSDACRATHLLILDGKGRPSLTFRQGETIRVLMRFVVDEPARVPLVGLELINAKGLLVHGRNSLQFRQDLPSALQPGTQVICEQEMVLAVDTGEYTIEIGIADVDHEVFSRRGRLMPADIMTSVRRLCHVTDAASITVVLPIENEPCRFSHYGAADLGGSQRVFCSPVMPSGMSTKER